MAADLQLVRGDASGAFAGELARGSGAAVRLEVVPPRTVLNLRGPATAKFAGAVAAVFGNALPLEPNRWTGTGGRAAIWLGPDEWLLVAPNGASLNVKEELQKATPDEPWLSVVDVSHNYTALRLSGPRVRELLAKGCALDLHGSRFSAGDCAQTLLAKTRVILCAVDDGSELWIRNSFAAYTLRWLLDASAEFRREEDDARRR